MFVFSSSWIVEYNLFVEGMVCEYFDKDFATRFQNIIVLKDQNVIGTSAGIEGLITFDWFLKTFCWFTVNSKR